MATIHTCDHESHSASHAAAAFVRLQKWHEKDKNTVVTAKTVDTCIEHMGEFVEKTFRSGWMDAKFYGVEVKSYRREDADK
jgi:hypothetical protein